MQARRSEELFAELVAFRRDLHMHPELGNQEFRTTAAIKERLEKAGLAPRVLPAGTGLVCDIGADAADTDDIGRPAGPGADDLIPGAAARYTQPSWNFRSAFPALPSGASGYPLLTRPLRVDGVTTVTLRAGGASFLRFAVAAGQEAMIQASAGGVAPPATLTTVLVRTR